MIVARSAKFLIPVCERIQDGYRIIEHACVTLVRSVKILRDVLFDAVYHKYRIVIWTKEWEVTASCWFIWYQRFYLAVLAFGSVGKNEY